MDLLKLSLIEQFTPVVVPLLVSLLVRIARRLPKWTVPVFIVPGLGALVQWIAAMVQQSDLDPVRGAMLGMVGLALREALVKAQGAAMAMRTGQHVSDFSAPAMDKFDQATNAFLRSIRRKLKARGATDAEVAHALNGSGVNTTHDVWLSVRGAISEAAAEAEIEPMIRKASP